MPRVAEAENAPVLAVIIIEPPPRATMSGAAIWHSQWLDRTLEFMILSKAESGISDIGP